MFKFAMHVITFAMVSVLSFPAFAQETAAEKAIATVQIDGGVIMVSDGGEFVTATQGQAVAAGDRLMVAKDSAVTVIYNDGCDQKYTDAGVYKIDPECKRAAGLLSGNSNPWKTATIIASAVAAGSLAAAIRCDNKGCCGGNASR